MQPVEVDGLAGGVRQAAGHPQQEVLRRLEHQPGRRVPQEVAVEHRAQAEVLETAVVGRVDRDVELDGVGRHERGGVVPDQTLGVTERDRLRERGDPVAAHLLVDVGREQPGRQPRVLGLLADQLGGGLDGEPVELGGRRAVVEPADGAGRDPQRVDLGQAVADPVDGTDDLVDVHRFGVAVALAHPHHGAGRGRCGGWGGRPGGALGRGGGHRSLLASSVCSSDRARGDEDGGRPPGIRRVPGTHQLPSADPRDRGDAVPGRARRDWQVFGLAGPTLTRRLLPVASQAGAQCCLTGVVPTHRCGAVPDFHRVPSCLTRPRLGRLNQLRHPPYAGSSARHGTHILWRVAAAPAAAQVCGSIPGCRASTASPWAGRSSARARVTTWAPTSRSASAE